MRMYYDRKLHVKLDLALSVAALIGSIVGWYYLGYAWTWPALIGVSLFLLAIIFAAYVVLPPVRYRQQPKYADEYLLEFSEDGIAFKTEHIDSKLRWGHYTGVWQNDRIYALLYGE